MFVENPNFGKLIMSVKKKKSIYDLFLYDTFALI